MTLSTKKKLLQKTFDNNLGHKICRLFYAQAQFLFTTNETEVSYYHQKMNIRVVQQVSERLKT